MSENTLDSSYATNYKEKLLYVIKKNSLSFVVGFSIFMITMFYSYYFFMDIKNKDSGSIKNRKNSTKEQKYTVQEGEDLWQIALKFYGSGYNAYDIALYNKLVEPYIVETGQELLIPSIAARFPTQGEISPAAASTTPVVSQSKKYTVLEGDFLWVIAQKMYGDGNMMGRIIEANKLTYPYTLEKGQVLIIPR